MGRYRNLSKWFLGNHDFSNSQANNAFTNQLLALRDNTNLRGRALRRQAFNNIVNSFSPSLPDIDTQNDIQWDVQEPDFQVLVDNPIAVRKMEVPVKQTFSEAFAAARRNGLSKFDWNGKSYTTQLVSEVKKPEVKSVVKQVTKPEVKPVVKPEENPEEKHIVKQPVEIHTIGSSVVRDLPFVHGFLWDPNNK